MIVASAPAPALPRAAQAPRGTGAGALHRFAQLTAGCAFLLLFAGGLVTSTGSSLAVPDWPLSFGQYFPRMVGGVLFEHGHRMIAGTVGLLTFALSGWVLAADDRRWMKRVAAAAAFGIVVQAVLGGVTVLYRLPRMVSVSHACLAQTVFSLLLVQAQATSPWFLAARSRGIGPLWARGAWAVGAIFLQLLLGAIYRHGGSTLPHHAAWAAGVMLAVGWAVSGVAGACASEPAMTRITGAAIGLLFLQLALGVAALAAKMSGLPPLEFWRVILPTAHVVVGAALLGTMVLWTLRAWRLR
ncbi:MAG: COX15/CtaA family protein [Elusimicrobia bacterium]|nr:COX15/CtaA family protein [Elusimicrobiota bacterium]